MYAAGESSLGILVTMHVLTHSTGIFGDYIQDNVVVEAGKTTTLSNVIWRPEYAGRELWRIGIPDKTSGEQRIL